MKIVFLVDARSAISRNWIRHFVGRGHKVYVISSYPCAQDVIPGVEQIYELPIAFSGFSRIDHNGTFGQAKRKSLLTRGLANLRSGALSQLSVTLRNWLGPLELNRHVRKLRELITEISPDLVHAMRIPFEGIMAAKSMPAGVPLIISVWGNDFTLFAASNPLIAGQTRKALRRADALHSDCHRDMRLATRNWGFDSSKPGIVLPSSGGVRTSIFYPEPDSDFRRQLNISNDAPVVSNPRGFRAYVRNEVFFQAIPLVLKQRPEAVFVCAGMRGNPVAERWAGELGITDNVRLLPVLSHDEMASLFRASNVTVSPSQHDGTPNSLLEAMACGCFPVAGDIESVREWITDKENGLLCDPTDKESIAHAIARAIEDQQLRAKAQAHNMTLVNEQAEYDSVMAKAEEFYYQVAPDTVRPVQV